jgi:hypothetical protein
MRYLKVRLFALALILIGAFLVYINWHQLNTEGTYSMKLAAFGPLVGVGGLYLLVVPANAGKPETSKAKVAVLLVFGVGIVAGLINWFLMDPGFFGR